MLAQKGSLHSCHTARRLARSISDYVYFSVVDNSRPSSGARAPDESRLREPKKPSARLKVPLLKSPQHFGHFTSRVNRFSNEDAYSALVLALPFNSLNPQLPQLAGQRFPSGNALQVFNFNVFDGHGGDSISKYLAANLGRTVELFSQDDLTKEHLEDIVCKYDAYFTPKPGSQSPKGSGIYWKRWLRNVAKNYEKAFRDNQASLDDLNLRLLFSYLALDYQLLTNPQLLEKDKKSSGFSPALQRSPSSKSPFVGPAPGGSTATSVFLYSLLADSPRSFYFDRNTVAKLVVSHVGDCKCIIVDKFGTAHSLTASHHPGSPIENMRLTKYSSDFFVNVDSFGEERFLNFANTRSFGDFKAKAKGITAEPEVSSIIVGDSSFINKQPDSDNLKKQTISGIGGDECFILLVSDGVTNFCTDQEMSDLIMSNYNLKGADRGSPQNGAEELVRFVEAIGGNDNATCLVIRLSGWGKWPIIDRSGKVREEKLNSAVFSNRRRDSL